MSVATIKLSETTKFIVDNRGKTVPTSDTGIPLIATNCIDSRNLYPVYEKLRYVSQDTYNNWFRSHPKPMDIILTLKGSQNGAVNLVPDPVDFCIAQDMVALRVDETKIDNLYLFAALRSEDIQDQIKTLDVSGVIPHFKKSDFDKLEIPLPPRSLQEFIGKTYFDLCNKIDLLHRQNKTLEAMAETLFRQWFIEEAKEDWLTVQVKDIVKQIKPGTNYQPKRLESGIPFLNVRNLKNGQIDLQGISFISQEEYERVHKAWKPEVGDVLISRIGTLGIVAVLGKRDMPMAVHYNMLVLKPNLTNTAFLYFLLRSQYFQDLYSSKARQSVQEYVAVEDAEAIELKLPLNDADFVKKEEQFSDLFNKIRANLAQIQTLEKLRDTLLPKLMSGEMRVQYQTEEVA